MTARKLVLAKAMFVCAMISTPVLIAQCVCVVSAADKPPFLDRSAAFIDVSYAAGALLSRACGTV
jgi:hypothetical protein